MALSYPPFKTKVVEPIAVTSRSERQEVLVKAAYNMFRIPSDKVGIDLLTDSGTGAMSAAQWGRLFEGDEAYAGATSFRRFRDTVRNITGMEFVLPVHQGRAGERIVFEALVKKGDIVPSNTAFDTTRGNLERNGAVAVDIPSPSAKNIDADVTEAPFKGDIDLDKLEKLLVEHKGHVPMVILTITDNAGGGQPLQPSNARAAKAICQKHGVPLWFDCARFAENAGLVIERDPESRGKTPLQVAQEIFALGDGALMSSKKDAIANMGGFVACRDEKLFDRLSEICIATEGFVSYGGLAGRDLEALAQGLNEALDPAYLEYRLGQTRYLHTKLKKLGVPVLSPAGGHAVFVDAGRMLPHIPAYQFPGQTLCCELYLEGGIRPVEIGSLMFGGGASVHEGGRELVRLAIPRRVYETAHLDFVAEACAAIQGRAKELKGFEIVEGSGPLRHFVAKLRPVK